jgi:hypothetical protein
MLGLRAEGVMPRLNVMNLKLYASEGLLLRKLEWKVQSRYYDFGVLASGSYSATMIRFNSIITICSTLLSTLSICIFDCSSEARPW